MNQQGCLREICSTTFVRHDFGCVDYHWYLSVKPVLSLIQASTAWLFLARAIDNFFSVFNAFGCLKSHIIQMKNNGAQGRNRTTDTRIFSPLLYQLSYLGDATREPRQAFGLYVITGALSRCAGAPETGEIQSREAFRLRLHMRDMTCLMVLIGKGFKSSVKGCCQLLLFDLCRFVCSYL